MQSICWTGRLLSRALWNGITNISTAADPHQLRKRSEPCLVSVACGFPKERVRRLIKGQFGDDAWFSAKCNSTADVLGVADGVGGWRAYGIDPGEFPSFLMRTCERLVTSGQFNPSDPSDLLARSYYELLEHKKPILGSSTACVIVLNKKNSRIYTANIGDSGFMIVRRGSVIRRSAEQQHYFNTPFQLSLPPPGHQQNVLSDRPESADTDDFPVEDGDVILLATDGVFDNVPDELLVTELRKAQGVRSATTLQTVANSIAWIARKLAFDRNFMSPFAQSAQDNGINAIEKQLKKKWQILRTGYRMRRASKSLPSGSGFKKTKKWVYYESLTFLEPYLTERDTHCNIDYPEEDPSGENSQSSIINEPGTSAEIDLDESTSPETSSEASRLSNEKIKSKSKKRKLNSVDKMFMDYLKSKKDASIESKTQSSSRMFLGSLLEDMSKLSPQNLRKFKAEVLLLLNNLLDNEDG